jgi:UPF0716 protein FxsA
VSDLLGLLLVLPPSRALARRWLMREAERRAPGLRTVRIRTGGPVIDGEVVPGSGPAGPAGPAQRSSYPDGPPRIIEGRVIEG